MTNLAHIRHRLAGRHARHLDAAGHVRAAVALLLREGSCGPEMLIVERARHEGDPWSGDLGFPGGKIENDDGEPLRAVVRETREEIGLDLAAAEYLGCLDDIRGAHLPVAISCLVFTVPGTATLTLGAELSDAFWIPLDKLIEPARHRPATVTFRGDSFLRPAIDLLGPDRPVLWGITYRLVMQFLEILQGERS